MTATYRDNVEADVARATLRSAGPGKLADIIRHHERLAGVYTAAAAELDGTDPARADLARTEGRRRRRLAAAARAALVEAKRCVRCGRPLEDQHQPGYAESIGPDCYRKEHPTNA